MQTLATPSPAQSGIFSPQNSRQKSPLAAPLTGDLDAARVARKTQLTNWSRLDLRQHFADGAWMRCHIKAAGLRAPNVIEPATVTRLRSFLKRANVIGQDITDSLGTTLAGYLKLNPMLPLWAALGMVLEATGRFTAAADAINGKTTPHFHKEHYV